jgi:3-oxoacyl-[acyl-carrier protein] reductase
MTRSQPSASSLVKSRSSQAPRRGLGPRKIRVDSINPGVVETEGTHTGGIIGSDLATGLIAQAPLGRSGRVGDIAPIAVFLASDDSGRLTGETHAVTGGIRYIL